MNNPIPDDMNQAQEELIVFINDSDAKEIFKNSSLSKFWCQMIENYQEISHFALKVILPFPATYLEKAFSSLLIIKSKYRNHLDVQHDLRCCLSSVQPRIDNLVSRKQAQPSH